MKRTLSLLLLSGIFLTAGCATARPVKDAASANVIYTNAPVKDAFTASCDALKNLGYKIDNKDTSNFSVKGSCVNLLTGHTPLHAEIKVTQDTAGTRITCSVDRPGAVKTLDVIGYYSANNIYKEIAKILAQDEINYRKANKEKQEKEARESAKEESYH